PWDDLACSPAIGIGAAAACPVEGRRRTHRCARVDRARVITRSIASRAPALECNPRPAESLLPASGPEPATAESQMKTPAAPPHRADARAHPEALQNGAPAALPR